jgi:hypothetical protein
MQDQSSTPAFLVKKTWRMVAFPLWWSRAQINWWLPICPTSSQEVPQIATLDDEIPRGVKPLESPQEHARPDVGGESPPEHEARPGVG